MFINGGKLLQHAQFDGKPITADIFITNYCNNRCPYCTYGRWELDYHAKSMRFEEFKKYAERLIELGVKGIILTGGGEPTCNPDFEKITVWLEENKIDYGINTNFNILKYFKPNYLKVSLDAYDEDSYKAYRGVDAYSKVRANILAYAEWKKTNSPNTTLGIQMVASNVETVNKFYFANKDLPVDYIAIRPMESTNGKYYKGDLSVDSKPGALVSAINTLAGIDPRIQPSFKWDMLNCEFDKCYAQWSQIAVNENGDVMYCCHKPYQIIGNIMDNDILQKKAEAVTDMKMCDIPCRLTAPNKLIKQIQQVTTHSNFI